MSIDKSVAFLDTIASIAAPWNPRDSQWTFGVRHCLRFACSYLVQRAERLRAFDNGSLVLDNSAGFGMVTDVLKERHPRVRILAKASPPSTVEALNNALERNAWENVDLIYAESYDMSMLKERYSHVFCTNTIGNSPDPRRHLRDLYNAIEPGGVVGVLTWSVVSWMTLWEQTIKETVNPSFSYAYLHTTTRDCTKFKGLVQEAGFIDVTVQTLVCPHPPEEDAQTLVEELWQWGLPAMALMSPGIPMDVLRKSKTALLRNFSQKYKQGRRKQAEVCNWAVARRPMRDAASDSSSPRVDGATPK